MEKVILFLAMIFMHIVDDFHIQAFLSSLKQKSWWEKEFDSMANSDDERREIEKKYGFDFVVGLAAHAFEWTFMFMLPLGVFLYRNGSLCMLHLAVFAVNVVFHAVVDHLKCNAMKLNLVQDQILHLVQMTVTFIIMIVL